MKKIKVMQFISTLLPGGAETLVKDYAIMLNDVIDSTVVIIAYSSDASNEMLLRRKGITVISIRDRMKLKMPYNILKRAYYKYNVSAHRRACAQQLKNIIFEKKPDCLHIHLEMLEYLEPIMEDLKGIKLFYTCHNLPSRMFHDKEMKIAKKLVDHYDMQILALHEKMAKEINDIFNIQDTLVVNNAIDFERFRNPSVSPATMREQLKIPKDVFVVGHVGRFQEQKNHVFLVDVFEQISYMKRNAVLLLVGNGELRKSIESKLKEKNLFEQCIILENRTDMENIFPVMDVFVFPSKWEGFGNVLIEAQVVGLPCIISDTIPEFVKLSTLVESVSLDRTASEWAQTILNKSCVGKSFNDLEKHNLIHIKKQLLKLYGSDDMKEENK